MQVIFQNLISCCGQVFTKMVVRKIKENHFFLILTDEVSDCSNPEQLFLAIRYLDSDCVIREGLLGLSYCDLGFLDKALALGGLVYSTLS